MRRKKLNTEMERYLLARALRGRRTDDDMQADAIRNEMGRLLVKFTALVGSAVAADYMEIMAQIIRNARVPPNEYGVIQRALRNYKRPPHRPPGSRSPRTGYGYGYLYLAQKRAGWTIAEIANRAKEQNDDPHDARLTIQAWRARVKAAISFAESRLKADLADEPSVAAAPPIARGLLG